MNFLNGIRYNLRGLKIALRNPKLLLLGLSRLIVVISLMVALTGLILYHHAAILNLLWPRPESGWFLWLWALVSWLLSLVLIGFSGILAYLIAQILFSVLIMDMMSRMTESIIKGQVMESQKMPFYRLFAYLIRQEIPRAILPVTAVLILMILGWLTPFGPILTVVSSAMAVIFLAWDNTDLIPARRLVSFRKRWSLLMRNLAFHLGFGIPFLIPGLNLLFLSFAPIGATLYYLDQQDGAPEDDDH
jgi:CysZ protein